MKTVTSKDGTTITYDQMGKGPALILVHGAVQFRGFDFGSAQLVNLLAPHFTPANHIGLLAAVILAFSASCSRA